MNKPANTYKDRILRDIESGRLKPVPGAIQRVVVLHEKWCHLLNAGDGCTCEPKIVYESDGGNA
jgi:hypothetical protein